MNVDPLLAEIQEVESSSSSESASGHSCVPENNSSMKANYSQLYFSNLIKESIESCPPTLNQRGRQSKEG